jgi:hypothetical protein
MVAYLEIIQQNHSYTFIANSSFSHNFVEHWEVLGTIPQRYKTGNEKVTIFYQIKPFFGLWFPIFAVHLTPKFWKVGKG